MQSLTCHERCWQTGYGRAGAFVCDRGCGSARGHCVHGSGTAACPPGGWGSQMRCAHLQTDTCPVHGCTFEVPKFAAHIFRQMPALCRAISTA